VPDNFKNILSNLSSEVDPETLLKYLNNQLPEDQKQAVEEKMLSSDFNNDALEGLQEIRDKEKISLLADQLNRDLQKKLGKKKKRRDKLKIKDTPWLYISILILLLLIVLSYFVIQRLLLHS
jgi:DNA primase